MIRNSSDAEQSKIETIEAHTGGEPLRIIVSGYPALAGETMLARRAYAREHFDHLRRRLMFEPRGHADMYGALVTAPATEDGDLGVLFMHNEGYSTMCGHGIIALVKAGLEHGLFEVPDERRIRIDTPAGRVQASTERQADGTVGPVSFLNVPSFVERSSLAVEVPGLGSVTATIAYGGAFYAYVDADELDLDLVPENVNALIEHGRSIKHAVTQAHRPEHPTGDQDLGFLYGTIFVSTRAHESVNGGGQANSGVRSVHSRNVCIFADGEVDRSPTGTGVSGRAAILHAAGELKDEWITIESILGSCFDVRVAETTRVGGLPAIVPEVRGRAHVTGRAEFWPDPSDSLGEGFLLR